MGSPELTSRLFPTLRQALIDATHRLRGPLGVLSGIVEDLEGGHPLGALDITDARDALTRILSLLKSLPPPNLEVLSLQSLTLREVVSTLTDRLKDFEITLTPNFRHTVQESSVVEVSIDALVELISVIRSEITPAEAHPAITIGLADAQEGVSSIEIPISGWAQFTILYYCLSLRLQVTWQNADLLELKLPSPTSK